MSLLKHEIIQDILYLRLSDSVTQNAFSPPMAEAFHKLVEAPSLVGVVLTNEGEVFCSGGNLSFYKSLKTKEEGLAANQRISDILKNFNEKPIPKAAFVNGPCYGGGLEMLSCFDFIVSSPKSLFGMWQRRVGLTFGWGGEERLAEKVGPQKLKSWLMSAQTISAYEASKLKLVDQVRLEEKAIKSCTEWVKRCNRWGEDELAQVMQNDDSQNQVFKKLWLGPKHQEALNRFK